MGETVTPDLLPAAAPVQEHKDKEESDLEPGSSWFAGTTR